jgi:hypothetical protein
MRSAVLLRGPRPSTALRSPARDRAPSAPSYLADSPARPLVLRPRIAPGVLLSGDVDCLSTADGGRRPERQVSYLDRYEILQRSRPSEGRCAPARPVESLNPSLRNNYDTGSPRLIFRRPWGVFPPDPLLANERSIPGQPARAVGVPHCGDLPPHVSSPTPAEARSRGPADGKSAVAPLALGCSRRGRFALSTLNVMKVPPLPQRLPLGIARPQGFGRCLSHDSRSPANFNIWVSKGRQSPAGKGGATRSLRKQPTVVFRGLSSVPNCRQAESPARARRFGNQGSPRTGSSNGSTAAKGIRPERWSAASSRQRRTSA